jgi:hypothetical protein
VADIYEMKDAKAGKVYWLPEPRPGVFDSAVADRRDAAFKGEGGHWFLRFGLMYDPKVSGAHRLLAHSDCRTGPLGSR